MNSSWNEWLTCWLAWGRRRVSGFRFGTRSWRRLSALQLEDRVVPVAPPWAVSLGGSGTQVQFSPSDTLPTLSYSAYEPQFVLGSRTAVGDITGDGVADLVTAAALGGGPRIIVFDGTTGNVVTTFFAFEEDFRGGAYVAVGDIDGDGRDDIMAGAGETGGPRVRAFSGRDQRLLRDLFVYDVDSRNGVRVASADINADGIADILTVPGQGGAAHIKAISGDTGKVLTDFMVGSPNAVGGAYIAAGDVDNDEHADIVVGAGVGESPTVTVFSGATNAVIHTEEIYESTFHGGVQVALAGYTDGKAESVYTAAGDGGGPRIRRYSAATWQSLEDRFVFDSNLRVGVTVAAGFIPRPVGPIATNDTATTRFETPVAIPVLANDKSADGSPLQLLSVSAAQSGTTMLVGSDVRYTPRPGFSGTDRFLYTIEDGSKRQATAEVVVTVTATIDVPPDGKPIETNLPPRLTNDTATTPFETSITVDVLANDSDPEGDPLTVLTTEGVQHGNLEIVDGKVRYTPSTGYAGQDTFTYSVTDGRGGTSTATVTITVEPSPINFIDWTAAERGGTASLRGNVVQTRETAVLREGNSFVTTLSKSFVIPTNPSLLSFTYSQLAFDTTNKGFVNDAFEVALLDSAGNPLVPTFGANRDAFWNITDGATVQSGNGVTTTGSTVSVNIASVPADTTATLVFRLINNDADTSSTVTLSDYMLPSQSAPAPVKFFVVDNQADTTFRYGDEGLGSGTFATTADPRGAASNPAGDTVWVVDRATKQVVIYNSTGTELGRWTPTDVNAPEGVSVVGGRLWLVDRETMQIFRYDGGAVRRGGTQTATGSFPLVAGNASPSDLVSDGTTIWVTDDATGEVFVYAAVDGSPLGEWQLDRDNTAPSGITKDPSGGTDIWVVDRAKHQVFEYRNGTDLRSGIATAAGTFNLAIGNRSPEGIADPPTTPNLQLTEAGLARGFSITTFVDGFSPVSGAGPLGVAFPATGGVLVTDVLGNIWKLPNSDDDQTVANSTPVSTVGLYRTYGLASANGSVYMVDPSGNGGSLVRLNDDGTIAEQVLTNLGPVIGVAASPVPDKDGHYRIYATTGPTNILWDLDPIARTSQVFLNGSFDGVSTDGINVYAAVHPGQQKSNVLGYNITTKQLVFDSGSIPGDVDGTALGSGALAGYIYANTNSAGVWEINLATKEQVQIAGGPTATRGDFVTVSPDGSLLLTQTAEIDRLIPPQGGGFGAFRVSVEASTAGTEFAPGTTVLITGSARSVRESDNFPGRIVNVTINDRPVDLLEESGAFFTQVVIPAGERTYRITATDATGQQATTQLTLTGRAPASRLDFSQFQDVSGSFAAEYARTSFEARSQTLFADVAIANRGNYPTSVPLLVGVTNISDPSVRVLETAGTTPDGIPYYDFTGLVSGGGSLMPGGTTGHLSLTFANPNRGRFTYDLVFFGLLNRAPAFTSIPVVEAFPDRVYTYHSNATDPDADTLTYSLLTGPVGLTIDDTTGQLSWTPTADQLGTHSVSIHVSDNRGGTAEQRFTITASELPPNRPPVFTTTPIVDATIGSNYLYDSDATDPDSDTLTYEFVGTAPNGMSIDNSTGVISWSPTSTGDFPITIKVADGRGGEATQKYTICVEADPNNRPPVIVSEPEKTAMATIGSNEAQQVVFGYGTKGFVYTVVQPGELPGFEAVDFDVSVFETGIAGFGTPGNFCPIPSVVKTVWPVGTDILLRRNVMLPAGTRDVHVYVSIDNRMQLFWNGAEVTNGYMDGGGCATNDQFHLVIPNELLHEGENLLAIRGNDYGVVSFVDARITANIPIHPDLEYSYEVTAVDPDPTDTLTYSLVTRPLGMSIESSRGIITWAPTQDDVGNHDVTIRVDDNRGGFDEQTYSLTVQTDPPPITTVLPTTPGPINAAPIFSPLPTNGETLATTGQNFRLKPLVHDPDGDPITFDMPSAPSGMAVHPTLGVVVWTPKADQLGTFNAVLRARDDHGNTTLLPFSVTVTAPNSLPIITSTPPVGPLSVQVPFEYQVTAQDADGQTLHYTLEVGQTSAVIDGLTGRISWQPFSAEAGTHTLVVQVSDGIDIAQQTITLLVSANGLNIVPIVEPIEKVTARSGELYVVQVQATDANGDKLTYTLLDQPIGMSISQTGLITWMPTVADIGPHTFRISISDGRGGDVITLQTVSVVATGTNSAPEFVSAPQTSATVGRPYRLTLKANDPDHDLVRYSLLSGPRGVSVDATTGLLLWTPAADQLGPQTIVVQAQDPLLASGMQTFTVTVHCVNQPTTIASRPPTSGYVGGAYFYSVRANDPDGDALEYSLLTKPTGMTIDAKTGVIRWIPGTSQTGPQAVVVQVDDQNGNLATQSFAINVTTDTPNRPPIITSSARTRASVGKSYEYAVTATDQDGDTLTYSLVSKPDGMTIDANGVITWQPTEASTPTVTIAVADPNGGRAVQSFVLRTTENRPPEIQSSPNTSAVAGATYRYDLRATDLDGDPLAYRVVSAPDGLTIDKWGRVRWSPVATDNGDKTVTLEVSDDSGATVAQSYIVTIGADTQAPNVQLALSRTQVNKGSSVTVTVLATDNVGVIGTTLTANGKPVTLSKDNRVILTPDTAGRITFVATATDMAGNIGNATIDLIVSDPSATSQVTAEITRFDVLTAPGVVTPLTASPTTPVDVTYLADIIGTVGSMGLPLDAYKVLLAPAELVDLNNINPDAAYWQLLGSGRTAVTNGKLATFDPTLLSNDAYAIAVVAYDVNGQRFVSGVLVNVVGAAKLGEFRLEFTDLSLPLNGIPIEINRVYDTRDSARSVDFGFGWTLGVRDARIRETVPDSQSFVPDKTKVYLTAPDGSRVGFTYKETQTGGAAFGLAGYFATSFQPDAGHNYKLELPDNALHVQGGTFGNLIEVLGGPFNPSHYRLTTPDGVSYDYDQFAGLQKIADMNNNIVTFTANEIRHSGGKAITLDRDGQGRITTIRLPDGNVALRYRYDSKGDLVGIQQITETMPTEEALSSKFTYRSDRLHYLDEYFDANGKRVVKTDYDQVTGRLISITGPDGSKAEQDFINIANFAETVKDKRGNPTFITYNDRGNVTKTVQPTEFGDIVTQFFYDDPRNPDLETKVINGRGFATTKTFDDRGNLLTETTDDGTTTYKYNAANKLTFVEDPLGRRTIYDYSPAGNLVQVVNPLGDDSLFTYDTNGRVATFEDFAGNVTTFKDYTPSGRPQTIINLDASKRFIDYNDYGQVTKVTDEVGNVTTNSYDLQGRLIAVTDGEQKTTTYGYEGANQVRITDPLGHLTQYKYDDGGRKTQIIDAENGVTKFTYDKNGNLETVTDSVNNVTKFVYDKANRLKEEIDPLLNSRFFEYDAAGNKTKATDRNGKVRTFAYDSLNRQTSEFWLDTGSVIRIIASSYDKAGNLLETSDPDAKLTYTYDALNRVKTATTLYPNTNVPTFTLTYGYDKNGNRTSVVDNTGVRVDSVYGSRNELDSRTWSGGEVDAAKVTFDYYANGERKTLSRFADATGTNKVGSTSYSFFANGLSKTITHANGAGQVLVNYDYQYDDAGRLKQETHHGKTYIYGYDKTGQLLTVNIDGALAESFSYDKNGNRLTSTGPNGNQTYAPAGPGNQLLNDGLFEYKYDLEGNLKTKTAITGTDNGNVTEYFWDYRNRLVRVEQRSAGGIVLSSSEYAYDPQGRRITQTINGQTLFTLYNREEAWVDLNQSGVVSARYLHADKTDDILTRWKPGTGIGWYLTDRLGTIRDLTDALSKFSDQIEYAAFGKIISQTNDTQSDRYSFTGREYSNGDLYYYRARYYDSSVGSFTTQDSIGLVGDVQLYRYVRNSPINAIDPSGNISLFSYSLIVGSVAFVARTAIGFGTGESSGDAVANGIVTGLGAALFAAIATPAFLLAGDYALFQVITGGAQAAVSTATGYLKEYIKAELKKMGINNPEERIINAIYSKLRFAYGIGGQS